MNRTITLLIATLTILAMVGAPAAVMAQDETENGDGEDAADVQPGEQLSGVIGVQDAEYAGEIEERGFGIAVANAATDDAKAGVVSERLTDVEERLDELENRSAALEEARESGNISEGQYRAQMAKLSAETATTERVANQSNSTAGELPAAVLESNGINVTAIETLQDRAHELSGPEVAEIAQSIAGPAVGQPVGPPGQDRIPSHAGPGEAPAGHNTSADDDDGPPFGGNGAAGNDGASDTDDDADIETDADDGSDSEDETDSDDETDTEAESSNNEDDTSGSADETGADNDSTQSDD